MPVQSTGAAQVISGTRRPSGRCTTMSLAMLRGAVPQRLGHGQFIDGINRAVGPDAGDRLRERWVMPAARSSRWPRSWRARWLTRIGWPIGPCTKNTPVGKYVTRAWSMPLLRRRFCAMTALLGDVLDHAFPAVERFLAHDGSAPGYRAASAAAGVTRIVACRQRARYSQVTGCFCRQSCASAAMTNSRSAGSMRSSHAA